jgi:hypothetical protein
MERKARQPNERILKKLQIYLAKKQNGETESKLREQSKRWNGGQP